jgi:hypothetical protein
MKGILVLIGFFILVVLLVMVIGRFAADRPEPPSGFERLETGGLGEDDVVIGLKPEKIEGGVLAVRFWADTHTVDLSRYDFEKTVVLEYDGKRIAPMKADGLKEHHSSGRIEFPIADDLGGFRIIITGIPAEQERVYTWEKKGSS